MRPNYAFENGRADKQRAFGERPWRRAAQRGRWTAREPAMKRSIQSLVVGAAIALGTFGLSYAASASKLIGLSHILYWQGWWLQTFISCPNIGTAENPICEGTPLNIAVFFSGIPFGIILYSLLVFGVLSVWSCRAA